MTLTAFAFALLIGPAEAGKSTEQVQSPEVLAAEHNRLSGEIRSLARRSAWKGVDRAYDGISLLQVTMSWEDHLYGAHASSELGDVAEAYDRLYAAVQLRPEKVLVDWLWDLDHSYGRVSIEVPGRGTLAAEAIPFDPVQRKAVELAIENCGADGRFEGMLPAGRYTFEGKELVVEAGDETALVIEPAPKRTLRRNSRP
jgi:hypothetical protein